jgi:hypothetical protein
MVSISSLWVQMPRQEGAYGYMGCGARENLGLRILNGSIDTTVLLTPLFSRLMILLDIYLKILSSQKRGGYRVIPFDSS